MKQWLWRALAGLGVCLLLVLGRVEAGSGADNHLCVACWGRSVGPWGEPALASPPAALARQATPPQARTAPSESGVVDLVLLTERDVAPMWLDSRGPPGKVRATWVDSRAAGQTGSPKQEGAYAPLQGPSPPSRRHRSKGGFATAFSYFLAQKWHFWRPQACSREVQDLLECAGVLPRAFRFPEAS